MFQHALIINTGIIRVSIWNMDEVLFIIDVQPQVASCNKIRNIRHG